MFKSVVGPLQPILAQTSGAISRAVLTGATGDDSRRAGAVDAIERQISESEAQAFDIDKITDADLKMPERPESPLTLADLDRIIRSPDLLPPGTQIRPLGSGEYSLSAPGMAQPLRVTTDPDYFSEHADSVELWSPGNPLFKSPELLARDPSPESVRSMRELLHAISENAVADR